MGYARDVSVSESNLFGAALCGSSLERRILSYRVARLPRRPAHEFGANAESFADLRGCQALSSQLEYFLESVSCVRFHGIMAMLLHLQLMAVPGHTPS